MNTDYKTQKELVLDYMRENGSITQYEATIKLGVLRLAAVIYELANNEGIDIVKTTETKTEKVVRNGKVKAKNMNWTRYSIK